MEIEDLFKKNCNEAVNTKTMVNEAMVSTHTLPLLLQLIFFTMQNVGIPYCFANCGTQHETR
jgi:hypothetical protein